MAVAGSGCGERSGADSTDEVADSSPERRLRAAIDETEDAQEEAASRVNDMSEGSGALGCGRRERGRMQEARARERAWRRSFVACGQSKRTRRSKGDEMVTGGPERAD